MSGMSFGDDFAVEVAPINFEDSFKVQQVGSIQCDGVCLVGVVYHIILYRRE